MGRSDRGFEVRRVVNDPQTYDRYAINHQNTLDRWISRSADCYKYDIAAVEGYDLLGAKQLLPWITISNLSPNIQSDYKSISYVRLC